MDRLLTFLSIAAGALEGLFGILWAQVGLGAAFLSALDLDRTWLC